MLVRFPNANLSVIGYAQVETDGTSPNANSGLTTELISTGVFDITLPADAGESEASCLALVQTEAGIPILPLVEHTSARVKRISLINRVNGVSNIRFYCLFLRTGGGYDRAPLNLAAYAKVTANGTVQTSEGILSVTRTGVGVYDIALPANAGIASNKALLFARGHETTVSFPLILVTDVSATLKRVTILDRTGNAYDCGFVFAAYKVP